MQICLNSLVPLKKNYDSTCKRNYNNYLNLKQLQQDTVIFGAKKSEFQGIDLLVVNKFKAPIEKFKTNDDLQAWCAKKFKEYENKDYAARSKQTTKARKDRLGEWFNYLKTGNDVYTNAVKLLVIDAITKELTSKNDNEPAKYSAGILADTITAIEEKLKNNKNIGINFDKLYREKLTEHSCKALLNTGEEQGTKKTGWVKIPSKINNPTEFNENVERLKALSVDDWCTKSFNAKRYLSDGDFHIYLENGKPQICIRFIGDEIEEIQGEKNDTRIPVKYLDIIKSYIKKGNYILGPGTKYEMKRAEKVKIKLEELQQRIGKPFNECSNEELFKIFGMFEKVDENGLFVLTEYKQPDYDFSWEDIGVNENKLFKTIKEIKGNANFEHSKVTKLGQLQSIGGYANFLNSDINDFGKLKEADIILNFDFLA